LSGSSGAAGPASPPLGADALRRPLHVVEREQAERSEAEVRLFVGVK